MAREQSGTVLIAMGVCGAGKTALAHILAARMGLALVDGDDHHSIQARDAMSRGEPLTDTERLPWIDRVAQAAQISLETDSGVVIACSALRKIYRDRLREHLPQAFFVHLTGDRDLIAKRLEGRRDHFVGQPLLDSQLATLEPLSADESGMVVDVDSSLELLSEAVLRRMRDAASVSLKTNPDSDIFGNRQN